MNRNTPKKIEHFFLSLLDILSRGGAKNVASTSCFISPSSCLELAATKRGKVLTKRVTSQSKNLCPRHQKEPTSLSPIFPPLFTKILARKRNEPFNRGIYNWIRLLGMNATLAFHAWKKKTRKPSSSGLFWQRFTIFFRSLSPVRSPPRIVSVHGAGWKIKFEEKRMKKSPRVGARPSSHHAINGW